MGKSSGCHHSVIQSGDEEGEKILKLKRMQMETEPNMWKIIDDEGSEEEGSFPTVSNGGVL